MKIRSPFALLLAGLLAACSPTEPDIGPGAPPVAAAPPAGISVLDAWARATAPGSTVGAVYFTVRNGGPAADVLLSVSSPAAERVELHRTTIENGLSRMRPASDVQIGHGQSIVAGPGGLHVMLLGLHQPLAEGGSVPLTLEFRDAGAINVQVEVRPIASGARHGQADGTDGCNHTAHARQRHVTT